jgi:hypothetical protein
MKKLQLNKETLVSLDTHQAGEAAGAGYISIATGCTVCVSAVTGFCPNSGHAPCSLRTGCCPL